MDAIIDIDPQVSMVLSKLQGGLPVVGRCHQQAPRSDHDNTRPNDP